MLLDAGVTLVYFPLIWCYNPAQFMSEYGFIHGNKISLSPATLAEKKAARKKLLDQVNERRKQNYQRYLRKLRDNLDNNPEKEMGFLANAKKP